MAHGTIGKPRSRGVDRYYTKGPKPSTPRGQRRYDKLSDDDKKQRASRWYN